ncbi:PREDICTED: putative cyclin-B3-1 isoform X1 [Nicotiana attenuata]|uniref:putative cyclin-B3-1 isoform X1 n=1 Tax=Nicotiana attenuata TaxID=49451 RepID=UPI000904C8A6|nr:PREDICTED: putative cyclin-B3-1 isoform X1 [Nicotiana attenuata]
MGKLNSQKHISTIKDGVTELKVYEEVDKIKIQSRDSLSRRCKGKSGAPNMSDVQTSRKSSESDIKHIERIKAKSSTSVKVNVKRKVLTDISNIRGNSSRTKSYNSSKLLVSDGKCPKNASNSTRKFIMGNVRPNLNGATGDRQILTRAPFKDMKASFDGPKTRIQGRKSVTTGIRPTGRNDLPPSRRSLPLLQQVNIEGTNNKEKGKVRANLNKATDDKQILTQAPRKDMKASFDGPKTRIQVRKSVTTGISFNSFLFGLLRRTGRNALPPSRRSLPILQQVNVESTNNKEKENSKKLEKGKGISGVSVLAKPKAAGDVLPQLSNHNNIRRNRVGDASARMAPRGQAKVEVGALRRKSVRTVLKITASSLNSQKSSKSNSISGVHKCTSRVAIPCKRLVDVRTSSLSKYATSEISAEQPHQKEVPSSSSGSLATPELSIARKKSDRRKSFTCLLMARSKLMKELCGNVELDNLSNIYDSCNHLEVTEYVDDIYQYYWVIEAQNQPIKNYMETRKEITPQMRGILINWLIEVHLKFDLMQETLFLMVTLLDYYLSLARVKKNDLQLVGLTSLLLASKYEDLFHPRVMDLLSISAESYTRDQMLELEKDILRKLKFRLNAATPYVFMLRLLKAAQADTRFEHLAFYLIELCLVEYEALNYKPSMLCASAIYVARCTMQMTPAWTPLLGMHARYQESQLRHCAEMILRFHKAASTALLKVTHEKYMQSSNSKVAAIKPLQSLP